MNARLNIVSTWAFGGVPLYVQRVILPGPAASKSAGMVRRPCDSPFQPRRQAGARPRALGDRSHAMQQLNDAFWGAGPVDGSAGRRLITWGTALLGS